MNLIDHWWVISFVIPSVVLALYIAVRFGMDLWVHIKRRKMHGEVYGSSSYVMLGQARPNFRRPG